MCPHYTIDNTRNKGLATCIATIRQSSLQSRDLLCNLCTSIVIDTATQQNECSILSFTVLLFRYPGTAHVTSIDHSELSTSGFWAQQHLGESWSLTVSHENPIKDSMCSW